MDRTPFEVEMAVSELATIRTLLDQAGVPDRGVGASVRVAEALGHIDPDVTYHT
jgi:hypothetical protein